MSAANTNQPVAPSALLHEKLAGVRAKLLAVSAGGGVSLAVMLATGLLAGGMLADWLLDLPLAVRAALLAVNVGALSYILFRDVLTPIVNRPDDDAVALLVERALPQFRSRLIAALQLARPQAIHAGASPVLVTELIRETETMARPVPFGDVVNSFHSVKLALAALIFLAAGVYGYHSLGDDANDLLKRAFLSQDTLVPRKTRVTLVGGDRIVPTGDAVPIEAAARGLVPNAGKLVVKYASGRTVEYPMARTNGMSFVRTLEAVQESFTFTVKLNDGQSQPTKVEVVPRPGVAGIEAVQDFPKYTELGSVKRSLGDLTLLAGSVLKLKVTPSKEVTQATVFLFGTTITNKLAMKSGGNGPELMVEIPVPKEEFSGFSIHLTDKHGFSSKDEAIYRVDVLPDKAPTVRITYPDRKEELITQRARMLMAFEALDDFAIAKVRLAYSVDGGATKAVPLDFGRSDRVIRHRYEWNVGKLSPLVPEGGTVEYWIEVEDNNDVTGPGVGASVHFTAKVVSDAEKRADLLNRAGDFLGSISDVANDQEKLNQRLGTLIREKVEQR
ncbi:MAG: hypothetical protein EXS29_03405 [Pedosphaera sp.]|nr:hypothetical protein [Pedosphaera sp.]MST00345.1 hypothetical protein [Pedosphaera sp.]